MKREKGNEMARIHEIEKMTEKEINAMAESWDDIKGHRVYFVDLGGDFGYSAMVCADGQHIKYADDYELHHRGKTHQELRDWYVRAMGNKLFTEDELLEPSDEYDERIRKEHYLRNYYSMRRPHVSIFGDKPVWWDDVKDEYVFSPVGFSYYDPEDRGFVEHMNELLEGFNAANDPLRSYETAFKAFKYEMYNHEYPINWQGDWDVINCFTKVGYKGDGSEIDQTGWRDEIKRAYYDAARYVQANGEW